MVKPVHPPYNFVVGGIITGYDMDLWVEVTQFGTGKKSTLCIGPYNFPLQRATVANLYNKLQFIRHCSKLFFMCKEHGILIYILSLRRVVYLIRFTQLTDVHFRGVVPCSIETKSYFHTLVVQERFQQHFQKFSIYVKKFTISYEIDTANFV